MDYRVVNEKNRARLQGQAGVYRVASELLLRGFNPTFPAVDCGADLIVDGGVRIQVKSAHLRYNSTVYPQGAYWFKLMRGPVAHGNHGLRPRTPRVFSNECDFVVFWGIEQHRFWVVPASIVDDKCLLILGPDVGWTEVDMSQAYKLREEGKTNQQISVELNISRMTLERRFAGKYVQPVNSRAMTYKVRECEGKWDLIQSYVDTLTEANRAVSTVQGEKIASK